MTRLSLFNPSRNLFTDFDRFFEDPFEGYTRGRAQFNPEADVEESERSYLLSFDLPGLGKEDVHVQVEGDTLTVTGERKWEDKRMAVTSDTVNAVTENLLAPSVCLRT
ncbi:MAG: Hsp20/alpha crystallin family protein [Bdellovibrionota bacterium]